MGERRRGGDELRHAERAIRSSRPTNIRRASTTLLRFRNGSVGKCAAVVDCLQPYYFHTHLVGSEGSILDNKFHSQKLGGLNKHAWSQLSMKMLDSGDVSDHPVPDPVPGLLRRARSRRRHAADELRGRLRHAPGHRGRGSVGRGGKAGQSRVSSPSPMRSRHASSDDALRASHDDIDATNEVEGFRSNQLSRPCRRLVGCSAKRTPVGSGAGGGSR